MTVPDKTAWQRFQGTITEHQCNQSALKKERSVLPLLFPNAVVQPSRINALARRKLCLELVTLPNNHSSNYS